MDEAAFQKVCRDNANAGNHGLTAKIMPAVRQYLLDHSRGKLPVVWLETSDSGDNNIAFMNTTYPYLHQVFAEMLDLVYSNTFMAAQGDDALALLEDAITRCRYPVRTGCRRRRADKRRRYL